MSRDDRSSGDPAFDATLRGAAPEPAPAQDTDSFDADAAEALLPDVPEIRVGDRIGEYEIAEKIGQGGFGSVYRAVQQVIHKDVAIKVLNPTYSARRDIVSRFISEARAANKIHHRCIVKVFSFGRLPDGRQYYVMDCLRGQPLNAYVDDRGGRMSPVDALPILKEVAEGIDAAHAAGIVHRDLKLENVFVCDDGAIKLLDFGIAKLVSDDVEHKTQTGAPMGTPHYMSPEQSRGRAVDSRTDIYAFGVMAYRIFTGKLPFTGDDFMDIALKQISEPPPPPSSVTDAIDPVMDAAILWMLEKKPDARPTSIIEAYTALAQAATEGGTAQVLAATSATAPNAMAETMPQPAPVPEAGSRKVTWLIAAGIAIAAAAVALPMLGDDDDGGSAPTAAPAPAAATETPAEPEPLPVAPAPAKPAASPTVEFTLELTPPDARVELDGAVVVGTTITLPVSDARHVLTATAEGHETVRYEFPATDGGPIRLALEPTRRRKPARKPRSRATAETSGPADKASDSNSNTANTDDAAKTPAKTRGTRVDSL